MNKPSKPIGMWTNFFISRLIIGVGVKQNININLSFNDFRLCYTHENENENMMGMKINHNVSNDFHEL